MRKPKARGHQSVPDTEPSGATSTNISVVQGKKRKPSRGRRNVSKARSQRAGLRSHQRKRMKRGPANNKVMRNSMTTSYRGRNKRRERPPVGAGCPRRCGWCLVTYSSPASRGPKPALEAFVLRVGQLAVVVHHRNRFELLVRGLSLGLNVRVGRRHVSAAAVASGRHVPVVVVLGTSNEVNDYAEQRHKED